MYIGNGALSTQIENIQTKTVEWHRLWGQECQVQKCAHEYITVRPCFRPQLTAINPVSLESKMLKPLQGVHLWV